MLEYINFFLLFALIFYLYTQVKRYIDLLKMAEEIFGGYETPQLDAKRQKLLECVLTGNSKLYLGKVHPKEQLKKLIDEEVEKLFNNYKAKLSGQMVKWLGCSINTHAGGDRNNNTQAWEQMGQCLCKHSFINLVQRLS